HRVARLDLRDVGAEVAGGEGVRAEDGLVVADLLGQLAQADVGERHTGELGLEAVERAGRGRAAEEGGAGGRAVVELVVECRSDRPNAGECRHVYSVFVYSRRDPAGAGHLEGISEAARCLRPAREVGRDRSEERRDVLWRLIERSATAASGRRASPAAGLRAG